jgi:hypothetical protein
LCSDFFNGLKIDGEMGEKMKEEIDGGERWSEEG